MLYPATFLLYFILTRMIYIKIFCIIKSENKEIYFSLSKELTKKFEGTIRGKNIRCDISEIKSFSSKGEFVLILLKAAKDKELNIEKIKN